MSVECPQCHSANPPDSTVCSNCRTIVAVSGESADDRVATLPQLPAEIPSGTIVKGKYRILGSIGKGGMGVVYKAEDLRLKRTVALKFLSPAADGNWNAHQRFVHEAQAASELDHPNICTVHEFDETEAGQTFIAMAYYGGETLKARIKDGPMGIDEALDVAIQLTRGLGKAHQRDIVHRDIKPANVLMTEDGIVKIVDFGLALLTGTSRVTRSGTTLGTVAYMSPEQAQGLQVDRRTDLWSLGVVLYEMLTGSLPFRGEHEASLLYSIVHGQPQSLKSLRSDVPPELERIVQRALEKDPESRYSSADEMRKDLEEYRESLRIAETGQFNLRLLLRRARRPRIAIPVIAATAVLVFLGITFWRQQARVRWARGQALPEIERMIANNDVWRNLTPAYRLAEQAEACIPHDPRLIELFSKVSLNINVRTDPPGANVYMKEYAAPESEWKYLGISPIEKVRVPIGIFRWKLEKTGYETVIAASPTWKMDADATMHPADLVRVLNRNGSIPRDMVRVSGTDTEVGRLDDFYIDRYEVTNKRYKEFINAGGYRNKKYWEHEFLKDGRTLPWEVAIKGFVDQTGQPGPATWQAGDYPEGQAEYPVSGISWYEAAAYAEFAGKALPTGYHWNMARGGYTQLIQLPQLGGAAIFAPFSNFTGKGPIAGGSQPGITSYGAFDMAGNVREWCWNETPKGRLIRGGAWDDNIYMFDILSQAPAMDRSAKNGVRCALYRDPDKIPESAFDVAPFQEPANYYKGKPVPDSIFRIYREQFAYDKTNLKARVESRRESPAGWVEEKVSFDAAYGGERVVAYLFLPRNAKPPYQIVIYFPGGAPQFHRSSKELESYYEFPMFLSFLVKNGRAVVFPVYKGTFERGNDAMTVVLLGDEKSHQYTHQYTDVFIQEVKDLRRCIDYLETRPDIDGTKVAYYGMSWGGALGAIIPAVEERLRACVLVAGGFDPTVARPEVNQINYVTRVKAPTLMLNGRYDTILPLETSSKPMFDLLGTPAPHKQMKLYETDHIPPVNDRVKETLAWFDRYLGPVR